MNKLKLWLVKAGLISIVSKPMPEGLAEQLPKRDATGRFILPKKAPVKKKAVAKKALVKKKASKPKK